MIRQFIYFLTLWLSSCILSNAQVIRFSKYEGELSVEAQRGLYDAILKNYIAYYIKTHDPDSASSGAIDEYLRGLPILDTSQYYAIEFEKMKNLKLHPDYDIYEYKLSVDNAIYSRCKVKQHILPHGYCFSDIHNVPSYLGKGLFAINLKTYEVMLVSGNLYLNDISYFYYSRMLVDFENTYKEFIRIRYYNFDPYDIEMMDNRTISFKTKNYLLNKECVIVVSIDFREGKLLSSWRTKEK